MRSDPPHPELSRGQAGAQLNKAGLRCRQPAAPGARLPLSREPRGLVKALVLRENVGTLVLCRCGDGGRGAPAALQPLHE